LLQSTNNSTDNNSTQYTSQGNVLYGYCASHLHPTLSRFHIVLMLFEFLGFLPVLASWRPGVLKSWSPGVLDIFQQSATPTATTYTCHVHSITY
jgi:hypothetical protein